MRATLRLAIALAAAAACDGAGAGGARRFERASAALLVSPPRPVAPVSRGPHPVVEFDVATGPSGTMLVLTDYVQVRAARVDDTGHLADSRLVSGPFAGSVGPVLVRPQVRARGADFVAAYAPYGLLPIHTRVLQADGGGPAAVRRAWRTLGGDFRLASLGDGGVAAVWSAFSALNLGIVDDTDDGGEVVLANGFAGGADFAERPDGIGLAVYLRNGVMTASPTAGLASLDLGGAPVFSPALGPLRVAVDPLAFSVACATDGGLLLMRMAPDAGVLSGLTFDVGNGGATFDVSLASSTTVAFTTPSGPYAMSFIAGAPVLLAPDAGGARSPALWAAADGGWLAAWLSADDQLQVARLDGAYTLLSLTTPALPALDTLPSGVWLDAGYELFWSRRGPGPATPGPAVRISNASVVPIATQGSGSGQRAVAAVGDSLVTLVNNQLWLRDATGDAGALPLDDGGCQWRLVAAGPPSQFVVMGERLLGGSTAHVCALRYDAAGRPLDPAPLDRLGNPRALAYDGTRYAVATAVPSDAGGFDVTVERLGTTGDFMTPALQRAGGASRNLPTALAGGAGELLVGWVDVTDGGTGVTVFGADAGRREWSLGADQPYAAAWAAGAFHLATAPSIIDFNAPPLTSPLALYTVADGGLSPPTSLGEGSAPALVVGPAGQLLLAYAGYDSDPTVDTLRIYVRFVGPQPDGQACGTGADCVSGSCVASTCVTPVAAADGGTDAGTDGGSDGGTDAGATDGGTPVDPGKAAALAVRCGCQSDEGLRVVVSVLAALRAAGTRPSRRRRP